MKNELNPGDKAPGFTLPDSGGNPVSLADFTGIKNLVVYFYPKDDSYGCTKEACSFRDAYDDFKDAGAEVIGISTDDGASHRDFASRHKLPFILLSDVDRKVATLYGVRRSYGILPGRVTFVIDKAGIVRMNFSSQTNMQEHIDQAISLIRQL
jgi:thioredoxin-dependent peroxiredoxin